MGTSRLINTYECSVIKKIRVNTSLILKNDTEYFELPRKFSYSSLIRLLDWKKEGLLEIELLRKMIENPIAYNSKTWGIMGIFVAELYAWFQIGKILKRPKNTILGYEVKPACPTCGI